MLREQKLSVQKFNTKTKSEQLTVRISVTELTNCNLNLM